MIYLPTLKQTQDSIKKIYNSVKIDLIKDTSTEGIAVNLAISNYCNANNPQATDLLVLRDQIYSYQREISSSITFFKASERILLTIQSFVQNKQLGNTQISQNFAKDSLVGSGEKTSADIIFKKILDELDKITIYSFSNIAKAICSAVDQADNYSLVQGMALDFSYYCMPKNIPAIALLNTIKNINSSNIKLAQDLVSNLYNIVANSYLSSNPIAYILLSYIDIYQMNHNANSDYSDIANSISNEMNYLIQANLTLHGISQAIANGLNAGSDSNFVGMLEAEYSLSNLSPTSLKQTMTNILGNDPIEIIAYIMSPLSVQIFSSSGPYKLMNAVSNYYTDHQPNINFTGINDLIKTSISTLSDQDSLYQYGKTIANTLNAGDDLAQALTIDFAFIKAASGKAQSDLRLKMSNCIVNEDNAAMFAYNFYNHLVYYTGFYTLSGTKPVYQLIDSIQSYVNKTNISFTDLQSKIINNIDGLSIINRTLDFVTAFANAFDMNSNKNFIDQIDLNYDAENIGAPFEMPLSFLKSSIRDGLLYDDAYVLASSYFAKLTWNIQSNISYDLLDITNNYLVPITEKVTITSALSNYTISPKENLYLNFCTKNGDNFLVGASIFTGFDPYGKGIKLSEMNGIDTIFGRISAIAQCGTAKTSLSYQDLYVTLSAVGGTIGDSSETGCTAVIDAATLGGYCNSVFYQNLPI